MAPGPLTLRELAWMAQARQRSAWERTSWLLALIANVNRDPKRQPRAFRPADFDPYCGQREKPIPAGKRAFELMKQVFCRVDNHGKEST